MPKGTKKSKARAGQQTAGHSAVADVTVYHFADADPKSVKSTGRISKAVSTWSSQVKQLPTKRSVMDDGLLWYEKDELVFDLLTDSDECNSDQEADEEEDSAQKGACSQKLSSPSRRSRRRRIVTNTEDGGTVYPLDLWFLISDWVMPEDIGTFARICQGCHIVIHSARFWYRLYDRCYSPKANLSLTLQPQSMERIHGLRDRVIRAVFLMYSPFQQRLQTRAPFEQDPDVLKGSRCTLMWFQQVKTHWHFYFKFSSPHNEKFVCPFINKSRKSRRHQNPLLEDANIHHNPETGNCVLKVVTQNFIPLPSCVMGQTLAKTSLNLGHGLRHHKLRLVFTPQHYSQGASCSVPSGTTVTLDPVLNAYVLNWWDPKYPHQPV